MLVTELGMVMLWSEVQPKNAHPPMLVTELGITTLVILLQPENIDSFNFFMIFGITISVTSFPSKYNFAP